MSSSSTICWTISNRIPNSTNSYIHPIKPYNFNFQQPGSSSNRDCLCLKSRLLCHNSNSSTTTTTSKAVISETPYQRVGAASIGPISSDELLQSVEFAAKTGAQVVMEAAAILNVVRKNFPDHLILGEEGGVIGDSSSDYLWCIDPLDGTTNFAHGYPSFAVSVGVLYRGRPAAAAVACLAHEPCQDGLFWSYSIDHSQGRIGKKDSINLYNSRGHQVERALLVTGFGYEHDDPWAANMNLFKEFTDISRGVRRLGAAAVDMCHVALGIVEAYWEYRLKPWDMAAGVLIVEEAGGAVSCMDGGKFTVFDRSLLVSNGVLHSKLLERIGPATEELKGKGIDFSLWYKPDDYNTEL
ncbi:hypothetical protein M8C21_022921 [Ambrosia artemisiifolia]|uniref:Inositol-1-monophosphatase n=1 Tax=Ambrosia artemisiifolia TaxID=4212 RepID=A0AAD5GTP7_AMBAR|nr:hypothetical protein M8C21_022921 [Ambrosia artemisiifolia]